MSAGSTVLHLLCRHKTTPPEVIAGLIRRGADRSARDELGRTPLTLVQQLRLEAETKPQEAATAALLEKLMAELTPA